MECPLTIASGILTPPVEQPANFMEHAVALALAKTSSIAAEALQQSQVIMNRTLATESVLTYEPDLTGIDSEVVYNFKATSSLDQGDTVMVMLPGFTGRAGDISVVSVGCATAAWAAQLINTSGTGIALHFTTSAFVPAGQHCALHVPMGCTTPRFPQAASTSERTVTMTIAAAPDMMVPIAVSGAILPPRLLASVFTPSETTLATNVGCSYHFISAAPLETGDSIQLVLPGYSALRSRVNVPVAVSTEGCAGSQWSATISHGGGECDWQCYLGRYEDLQIAFGTDTAQAEAHYTSNGAQEGRICTCETTAVLNFTALAPLPLKTPCTFRLFNGLQTPAAPQPHNTPDRTVKVAIAKNLNINETTIANSSGVSPVLELQVVTVYTATPRILFVKFNTAAVSGESQPQDFTITVNSVPAFVTSAASVGSHSTMNLTVASNIMDSDTVTLSYEPGSSKLASYGGRLPRIGSFAITNDVISCASERARVCKALCFNWVPCLLLGDAGRAGTDGLSCDLRPPDCGKCKRYVPACSSPVFQTSSLIFGMPRTNKMTELDFSFSLSRTLRSSNSLTLTLPDVAARSKTLMLTALDGTCNSHYVNGSVEIVIRASEMPSGWPTIQQERGLKEVLIENAGGDYTVDDASITDVSSAVTERATTITVSFRVYTRDEWAARLAQSSLNTYFTR
jgi:hypothetical protein